MYSLYQVWRLAKLPNILIDGFHGFPQFLKVNVRIVPSSRTACPLLNPHLQNILHYITSAVNKVSLTNLRTGPKSYQLIMMGRFLWTYYFSPATQQMLLTIHRANIKLFCGSVIMTRETQIKWICNLNDLHSDTCAYCQSNHLFVTARSIHIFKLHSICILKLHCILIAFLVCTMWFYLITFCSYCTFCC
jgi:hypothetical protein